MITRGFNLLGILAILVLLSLVAVSPCWAQDARGSEPPPTESSHNGSWSRDGRPSPLSEWVKSLSVHLGWDVIRARQVSGTPPFVAEAGFSVIRFDGWLDSHHGLYASGWGIGGVIRAENAAPKPFGSLLVEVSRAGVASYLYGRVSLLGGPVLQGGRVGGQILIALEANLGPLTLLRLEAGPAVIGGDAEWRAALLWGVSCPCFAGDD